MWFVVDVVLNFLLCSLDVASSYLRRHLRGKLFFNCHFSQEGSSPLLPLSICQFLHTTNETFSSALFCSLKISLDLISAATSIYIAMAPFSSTLKESSPILGGQNSRERSVFFLIH